MFVQGFQLCSLFILFEYITSSVQVYTDPKINTFHPFQSNMSHHILTSLFSGEGCFGQVWKCEALNIDGRKGVTMVAVKTLKESASNKEKEELVAELNLMKTLLTEPHTNVVRLLGCCTSANDKGEPLSFLSTQIIIESASQFH